MANGDTDGAAELEGLAARKTELAGFRAAILEELGETAVVHEVLTLRQEMGRVEDAIRALNVREFELRGKIKRAVGAQEVKCPTCERYLAAGTILSEGLKKALTAD